MRRAELDYWTDTAVRQYLEKLVDALDALDEVHAEGTENNRGWRYHILGEE